MSRQLSIYLHIPFCKTICTFCNFATFAHKKKWIPEYIEALLKELNQKSHLLKDSEIVTIYFGGGTPSLIDTIYIEKIINEIRQLSVVKNDCSIELEANPETLSLTKLNQYQKIGINRISLGVQTLDSKSLFKVARSHDGEQALQAMQMLNEVGFENFGVDLIMGMPYQTVESFTEELNRILEFNPKHLSAYFLSYDTKKIDTFINDSPNEEEQLKMYWKMQEISSKAGFEHYEVSNYARPGFESKHNLRYWNQEEYLGLGLGAHSYLNREVWENNSDFDIYLKKPAEKIENKKLDPEELQMDYIMLKLRQKNGINFEEFRVKFGKKALDALLMNLKSVPKQSYANTKSGFQLNNTGFLFIDNIQKKLW